jgi:hypothetical protein
MVTVCVGSDPHRHVTEVMYATESVLRMALPLPAHSSGPITQVYRNFSLTQHYSGFVCVCVAAFCTYTHARH